MPSRRDLLSGVGVAALGGFAGCLGGDEFGAPETPTDEWWTARHDTRNTACAPNATPPDSEPERRWSRSFETETPVGLLVSADSVYAVRETGTDALGRDDGAWKWNTHGGDQTPASGLSRVATLAPDTLYTADGRHVRAFDRDGTVRWQTAYPNTTGTTRIYGVLPTDDGVLLGDHGRLLAFDSDGNHRWTFGTNGADATYPGVAADGDGGTDLLLAAPGPLQSLSSPTTIDSLLGRGPSVRWETSARGRPTWPVVTDEYVVVGDTDRAGGARTHGDLHVYRRDGTRVRSVSTEGGHPHLALTSDESAIVYGTGVGGDGEGTVTALELASGETRWARDDLAVADWGTSLVVSGETCLFAGATDDRSSRVHALDAATGETKWTLSTEAGTPESVVAAGPRVYVVTTAGVVAAYE
ncbi:Outer membrane protein assembly factor BamB, contains PQQ-like beta-propeller repeat [Halogeometricum rufum]|uniref:Outer membrane protein assembly factor BamB, contains PQQ-like beta-propeller repeat n=1 Tax=Halogeometricum rufum TaxID=553469 RepID=A0A1I6GKW7_9EURY|nr:PQQ-binding-like beta-propeller repeat protein [Halogeometricum rufum]SFR42820.1 Outer membrane protein assembly factor BamB, contains PQQ-like beta-propeller repeat [Halogeometricum rufum]